MSVYKFSLMFSTFKLSFGMGNFSSSFTAQCSVLSWCLVWYNAVPSLGDKGAASLD